MMSGSWGNMESEKGRMTRLQQLEQDVHTINGLHEHGSYCECIWCLEKQKRFCYNLTWRSVGDRASNDGNAEGFASFYCHQPA